MTVRESNMKKRRSLRVEKNGSISETRGLKHLRSAVTTGAGRTAGGLRRNTNSMPVRLVSIPGGNRLYGFALSSHSCGGEAAETCSPISRNSEIFYGAQFSNKGRISWFDGIPKSGHQKKWLYPYLSHRLRAWQQHRLPAGWTGLPGRNCCDGMARAADRGLLHSQGRVARR